MFGLFANKPAVKVEKINALPSVAFNHKDPLHLELIQEKINSFSQALARLQALDRNIVMGAAIGTGCYIGSYVFPLVLVSIAGACLATWNTAMREQVLSAYRKALHDLIEVYQWSMGKDTGNHWEKLAVKVLQDLILVLGPWVSSDSIHTWTNADLKPSLLSFCSRRKDIPEAFEMQLIQFAAGTQTTSWEFRLYGEHGIEHLCEVVQMKVTSQMNDLLAKTMSPK